MVVKIGGLWNGSHNCMVHVARKIGSLDPAGTNSACFNTWLVYIQYVYTMLYLRIRRPLRGIMMLWRGVSWVRRAMWARELKFSRSWAGTLGDLEMCDALEQATVNMRVSRMEEMAKFLFTLKS